MSTSKVKYLKYKNKYLQLKSLIEAKKNNFSGGGIFSDLLNISKFREFKSIFSVLDLPKYRKFKSLQNEINKNLDFFAIKNNLGKKKYLITDTEIELNDFQKIKSIDDIEETLIKDSLFFIYFETDDQYLPHLDKIIEKGGKLIIHKNYNKFNYVHSNKNCKLALLDTMNAPCPSHYDESIHQNICQALEQTKHLGGDYVEIGVYKGGSALTALNYIKHAKMSNRKSYFLDTFEGFDYEQATSSVETHWNKDNLHHKLWGVDKTMKKLKDFLESKCPNQDFELIKSNICIDSLPDKIQRIVVANIDVDILEATRDALNKVHEKMVKGGIIICEDPTSTPALIGAFYAMEKFLETQGKENYMKLHLFGQYFLIKLN